MAVDPTMTSASAYKLLGDGRMLCAPGNPSFVAQTRLVAQVSQPLITLYGECLRLRKGSLPYQTGALVGLNFGLQEVFRYSWRQAAVEQIQVPAADLGSSKVMAFKARLSLPGIVLGDLPRGAAPASTVPVPLPQESPVYAFLFRLRITGLEDASRLVTEVGPFNVGLDAPGDVSFTIPHDGSSGPFRDWLQSGNGARSATLEFLATNLASVVLKFQFLGLRIRSIDPAYSTFSMNPARLNMNFQSVTIVPV